MRARTLSAGWYPESKKDIRSLLNDWDSAGNRPDFNLVTDAEEHPNHSKAVAGVVPHAGWTFCGSMIYSVLQSFPREIETIVVLGGHNSAGGKLVVYSEDSWCFPTGVIERDCRFADAVSQICQPDYTLIDEFAADNTVEVVMAMAAAMFPAARWAAWRVPADGRSQEFGRVLNRVASELGRKVMVLGSTDLTHYGPGFGFTPADSLEHPAEWTAERDKRELEALRRFQTARALMLADMEKSACSAGAAAAASAFAAGTGADEGRILEYRSSRDVQPAESFVGYGAIIWER